MPAARVSAPIALAASSSPSAADTPAPSCPARPQSAAWQQAVSNHCSPDRDSSASNEAQRAPGIGPRPGGLAQVAAGETAVAQAPGQGTAVLGGRRVLLDQL